MSNTKSLFVTATDTDAGKTYISEKLIKLFVGNGYRVSAFKPVSAGCDWRDGELQNEDALRLQAVANCGQELSNVNPIAFEPPIAPHIAAAEQGKTLNVAVLSDLLKDVTNLEADLCLVEGAGGWRLPLNDEQYMSEFVQHESMPVILVVGMRLGCLNHAILTYQSLLADGIDVIGWVANQAQAEKMSNHQENITYLKNAIKAPCLGEFSFNDDVNSFNETQLLTILRKS